MIFIESRLSWGIANSMDKQNSLDSSKSPRLLILRRLIIEASFEARLRSVKRGGCRRYWSHAKFWFAQGMCLRPMRSPFPGAGIDGKVPESGANYPDRPSRWRYNVWNPLRLLETDKYTVFFRYPTVPSLSVDFHTFFYPLGRPIGNVSIDPCPEGCVRNFLLSNF